MDVITLVPITFVLSLLNLTLTGFLYRRLFPKAFKFPEIRLRKPKVLPRAMTVQVSPEASMSYWQRKGQKDAEPFIAMYFKNSGIFDGIYIPSNSYLLLDHGAVCQADRFESMHEQAKVAIPLEAPRVEELKSNFQKVVLEAVVSPPPSPEEEEKLAKEYELVENPPSLQNPST
jgi:hypothetical protein